MVKNRRERVGIFKMVGTINEKYKLIAGVDPGAGKGRGANRLSGRWLGRAYSCVSC